MAFWLDKPLARLTPEEWESLCDGCGKCCLEKLEDVDTGEVAYTEVACRLLDLETCRCRNYVERRRFVPDCVPLSPKNVKKLPWMPTTCAYRLLTEGKDLPAWHPLVTGDPESVHGAGQSVRGRAVAEKDAGALEDHVVDWPA
ncbi:MAG: YcgN family cysteine cluster protein [Magnetospirillum sp. WYHS-4]